MSETRERVLAAIDAEPGIHFRGLVRRLDLAPGQVQHHVRRLRRSDSVVAEDHRGRTHYYRPAYDERERAAIAALRRETARDVVAHLLERGARAPAEVADAVGIARSTLSWHVDALAAADLVEKRRPAGNRVVLALADPAESARLLSTVAPGLADRLVDRFERLVDDLLEGG